MITTAMWLKILVPFGLLVIIMVAMALRFRRIERELRRESEEKFEKMRLEFAASVTHELKTPLQTMVGYAELISMDALDQAEIKEAGIKIRSEAFRMNDLIDDIVRISDLNDSTKNIVKEDMDLAEVAAGVVESLEREAGRAGVSIEMEKGDPDCPDSCSSVIYACRDLVEILIYNLCENAIKYNRVGGRVRVHVDGHTLTVRDNGVGIPEADRARIFEMFYRIDKNRSRELGGNGLGLGIVKLIAQRHNAKVTLQSEVGIGTVVSVEF